LELSRQGIESLSAPSRPSPSSAPLQGSPSIHLDALRGLAAFSVLLNHWRDAFFVDYPNLRHHNPLSTAAYLVAGLGHQWVIVFFVMSGYLVGGSVLRSVQGGRWSWRPYLLSRLTRLYIVLLPALLLGGMIDWTGMHVPGTQAVYGGHSGMHALAADVHRSLTPEALAGNLLFLQTIALPGMNGHRVYTFGSNGPLWSLANEFWYYMAFPLLLLMLSGHGQRPGQRARAGAWRLHAACAAGLVAWGWFVGPEIALLGICWLMGAAIAKLPPLPCRHHWTRRLAIGGAMTLFGGALVMGKLSHTLGTSLVLGLAVAVLIWITVCCATAPVPRVYTHVARHAARSSYTLYLVHLPFLVFLKACLHLPRAFPGWSSCLAALGVMAVTLMYAHLVYLVFEKNTDRVRDWLRPRVMGKSAA